MLKPLIDDDGAPFFEYAARGELRMQACADCGEVRFPPRPMCPHCQSTASEWKLMSGRGTIWSFAVPHPPLLPDYAVVAPYAVVVVELAEDRRLRLAGNLVRADDPSGLVAGARSGAPISILIDDLAGALTNAPDPATIEIGDSVEVVFREIEGVAVACWTPADAG
jgi:uncharacterized OB-fold protein